MAHSDYLRQDISAKIITLLDLHAKKRGFKVGEKIQERVLEIVNELFKTNNKRLMKDFEGITTKAMQDRLAFSLGDSIAELMTENAAYENREEIVLGDLYLAMLNFRTMKMWPWTGGKKP